MAACRHKTCRRSSSAKVARLQRHTQQPATDFRRLADDAQKALREAAFGASRAGWAGFNRGGRARLLLAGVAAGDYEGNLLDALDRAFKGAEDLCDLLACAAELLRAREGVEGVPARKLVERAGEDAFRLLELLEDYSTEGLLGELRTVEGDELADTPAREDDDRGKR